MPRPRTDVFGRPIGGGGSRPTSRARATTTTDVFGRTVHTGRRDTSPVRSGSGKKHKSFWAHVAEPFVNTGHQIEGLPVGIVTTFSALGKDIAEGLNPTHIKHAGKNPIPHTYKDVIVPAGKSYAYKYGPLFAHGDFRKTGGRMLVDPLGTASDIFTALTLGEGGLTKAGLLGARPTSITLRASRAMESDPHRIPVVDAEGNVIHAGEITKRLAGTGFSKRVKGRHDAFLKAHVAPGRAIFGEESRYARAEWLRQFRGTTAKMLRAMPFINAEKKLNHAERTAANLMHSYPSESALKAQQTRFETERAQIVREDGKEFHSLLSRTRKAEARVQREHGPAPPGMVKEYGPGALRGGRGWRDFSEARGYTEQEIADFARMLALSREYPGLEPDLYHAGQATSSLKQIREHIANSEPVKSHGRNFTSLVDEASPGSKAIMDAFRQGLENPKIANYLAESQNLSELAGANSGLLPDTALVRRYAPLLEQQGARFDYLPFDQFDTRFSSWVNELRAALAARDREAYGKLMNQGEATFKLTPERINEIAQSADNLLHPRLTPSGRPTMIGKTAQVGNRSGTVLEVNPLNQTATVKLGFTQTPTTAEDIARFAERQQGITPEELRSGMYESQVPFSELRSTDTTLLAPGPPQLPEANLAALKEMIDKINEGLAKEGRPEPLYRTEAMISDQRSPYPSGGAGRNPSPRNPLYKSEGSLRSKGNVDYTRDTLAATYMRTVRYVAAKERHEALMRAGTLREVGRGLPSEKGWEYVKKSSAEKIGYQEANQAQLDKAVQDLGNYQRGEKSPFSDLKDDLSTPNAEDAEIIEAPDGTKFHVVVPTRVVDKIVGDFHYSTRRAAKVFKSSTNAWRALVLNLRLGWLANNVIGNTLMYGVGNTGPGTIRSLIGHHAGDLTALDMERALAEQTQSFIGSTRPPEGTFGRYMEKGPVRRGIKAIPRGFQDFDKRYERHLRRATANRALNRALKDHPDLQPLVQRMNAQGATLRETKIEALQDPATADMISSEVSRTLGDFNDLSAAEQTYVRSLVPFYAWYKAITRVMLRMPMENPIRTTILTNLGNIGYPMSAQGAPVPGAFQLPGGWILKTGGYNPYATLPQVGANVSTLSKALVGNLDKDWGTHFGVKAPSAFETAYAAGIFNPFYAWPMTGGLSHTARYLPETRIFDPPHSRAYQNQSGPWLNRLVELANYAGVGLRKPAGG